MQHPLPQPCAPAVPTAASTSAASPEAVKAIFSRAVHAVFGEWTALKLAVENEFAGSGTRARALAPVRKRLYTQKQSQTPDPDPDTYLIGLGGLDEQ